MTPSQDPHPRQDLLYRLQWNLCAPLSSAEILTGPPDLSITTPFSTNPLADSSLFSPPLSCVTEINIRDFGDKTDRDIYYPAEQRYKGPDPLRISNDDGSSITLKQFVEELHAYVQQNMAELKRIKSEMYGEEVTHADGTKGRMIVAGRPVVLPEDIAIWFSKAMVIERDGGVGLSVSLWAEGETTWPRGFWKPRAEWVRRYEVGGRDA